MATLFTDGKFQAFDSNGDPLSSGKLYTYEAGTTTPLATYTDQGGATPNANPVILDSAGRANVWLAADDYRFILKTSADSTIWDVDNVKAQATYSDVAAISTGLAASSGSSLVGYIQTGTGATATTVQAKLRQTISVIDYGADKTGVADSTTALTNAIAALPSTGGSIYFPAGTYKLTSTVTVTGKTVSFYGDGSGQTTGTTAGSFLKFYSLGTSPGLVFDGVDGHFIRDLAIVADSATRPTGGYLVTYQGSSAGWYHATWNNVLCAGGYNGLRLKNGFYLKAFSCVWKTFDGANVMLFNGSADADDVQSCEFTNCTIAAESSTTTDLVVLDGYAASTKFVACAFLFGRKGLWLKDSYTTSNDPDFTYVIGGGFENGEGDAICAEAGNHLMLTGAYISTDGDRARCVYVSSGFGGEITMSGCYVRGGARGGVWLEDGNANITGNTIINNNEAGPVSVNISNCANNGSGLIRVTTATHGYETNDMVTISGVVGTTEANGTWVITVINSTTFDLAVNADSDTGAASVFANAYVSDGTSQLATASVRVLSGAEWVNVQGNTLGGGSGGIRSTEYGVHSDADNVFATHNQCQSVVNAPWKSTRNTRSSYGNKNLGVASGASKPDPYAVDGSLVYMVAGATTTGVKNLNNCVYISGYKIRVIRATRVSSNASNSTVDQTTAKLRVNGSDIGTALDHPLAGGQLGTTVTDTLFGTPLIIDGTTTPQRVEMNVTAVTGTPDDVAWDWQYQIIN